MADELFLRMGGAGNGGFGRNVVDTTKDGMKSLPNVLVRDVTGGGGGAAPMVGGAH